MSGTVKIFAVNVEAREVLTDNGVVLHITHLYDATGNETNDPDEATTCVAGIEDKWLVIDLREFDQPRVLH